MFGNAVCRETGPLPLKFASAMLLPLRYRPYKTFPQVVLLNGEERRAAVNVFSPERPEDSEMILMDLNLPLPTTRSPVSSRSNPSCFREGEGYSATEPSLPEVQGAQVI